MFTSEFSLTTAALAAHMYFKEGHKVHLQRHYKRVKRFEAHVMNQMPVGGCECSSKAVCSTWLQQQPVVHARNTLPQLAVDTTIR